MAVPKMRNARSPEQWAYYIRSKWQDNVDGILELGLLLSNAREVHRNNKSLFWDRSNWQPACEWHHNTVKKALEALFDVGEIGADQLRLNSRRRSR